MILYDYTHNSYSKRNINRRGRKPSHSYTRLYAFNQFYLYPCFFSAFQLCACFRKKGKKENTKTKIIPPTFILKLFFTFVRAVAFQTSLRSYGSRRSWWLFFLLFAAFFRQKLKDQEDFVSFNKIFYKIILVANANFVIAKMCFKRICKSV